jgi:hypothetical protein
MTWKRKATRYNFGKQKENQLYNKITQITGLVGMKSRRSLGIFDLVFLGCNGCYAFQAKRTDKIKGGVGVRVLLAQMDSLGLSHFIHKYVAVWRAKGPNRGWRFYRND